MPPIGPISTMIKYNAVVAFVFAVSVNARSLREETPKPLGEKLAHQFHKFETGHSFLVDKIVVNDATVSREDWEAYLAPDDGFELDPQDLEGLSSFHTRLVEEAAAAAKRNSVISIDDFRSDREAVQQFCRNLPRAALLHIHPVGTMNPTTATHLLEKIDPIVDTQRMIEIGEGELTMLYEYEVDWIAGMATDLHYSEHSAIDQEKIVALLAMPLKPPCHSFVRFEAVFSLKNLLLADYNNTLVYEEAVKDFCERNKAYGISYVEFTSVRLPPSIEKLQTFNDKVAKWSSQYDMDINFNSAYVRTMTAHRNDEFAETFLDSMTSLGAKSLDRLVGIDLLANEKGHPALESQGIYVPISNAWQNGDIQLGGLTMHAGEKGVYGPQNVRDGLIFGVTRIGHGPLLYSDPLLLEYARRKKVPFVISIISNYVLSVIPGNDIKNHPFLHMFCMGIPITLSTDDEGFFHTDIVNECVIAIENTDIQYSELKEMSYISVNASFAEPIKKQHLFEELDAKFEAFEAQSHPFIDTEMY